MTKYKIPIFRFKFKGYKRGIDTKFYEPLKCSIIQVVSAETEDKALEKLSEKFVVDEKTLEIL